MPYNAAGEAAAPMASLGRGLQGAGPVAVHPLQPDPRRPAVHDDAPRTAEGLAILDEALEVADDFT